MPEQQTATVGISSSVAIFLLLSSVCCMLSLSSPYASSNHEKQPENNTSEETPDQKIRIPSYVPHIAMTCVMVIAIVAMTLFVFKKDDLTTPNPTNQSTNRHKIHRNLSLWSITAFFVGVFIFAINHLIVETSCRYRWTDCDNRVVYINNLVIVVFNIVCLLFASCETIVCWIIKPLNFKSTHEVWYGLAVVQAANTALWFSSILKEWGHRVNDNVDAFETYFYFCNASMNQSYNDPGGWCTKSSIEATWFLVSIPFLFPITIEFSLLVSETFLEKVIVPSPVHEQQTIDNILQHSDEPTPLEEPTPLSVSSQNSDNEYLNPENVSAFTTSTGSKVFVMISVIINIVYFLLDILVFVGYKIHGSAEIKGEWQVIKNVLTVYVVLYFVFFNACLFVGIYCCRKLRHEHTHTTFLEYLLLFSTCGVLFQCIKRFLALTLSPNYWNPAYCTVEILDVIQVLLQIVFYFYAKDVKLQLTNDNRHEADDPRIVAVFPNMMVVIAVSNFVIWFISSFFDPEMDAHVTPSSYKIEPWPVFDNVVTPVAIFFRFNSALLFWGIGTNIRLLLRRH